MQEKCPAKGVEANLKEAFDFSQFSVSHKSTSVHRYIVAVHGVKTVKGNI